MEKVSEPQNVGAVRHLLRFGAERWTGQINPGDPKVWPLQNPLVFQAVLSSKRGKLAECQLWGEKRSSVFEMFPKLTCV